MVCFSDDRWVEYRVFNWDETVGIRQHSYVTRQQMFETLEECQEKQKILNDIFKLTNF
jgi:hypothetical protein